MINVGLIGLGPFWEQRYRPVLERFRSRIRVCAVYDPVASRAQIAAHELEAPCVQGISALVRRSELRAVLLLDNAWQGVEPLRMVLGQKKSAYIAGSLGEDVESIARRHLVGLSEGLTLMPEFSRRYTPATSRLQELMATQIGPPRRIRVRTTLPQPNYPVEVPGQANPRDFLVGLIDWCRHIIRLPPAAVEMILPPRGTGEENLEKTLRIEFNQSRMGGEAPTAELQILKEEPTKADSPKRPPRPQFEVVCARGKALFSNPLELTWTGQRDERVESLVSERSEVEVMLDHFCRRVVGGLIPVADLADICGHIRLLESAERSLSVGRAVKVSPYN
ncbi:MAG: Gfo/Idh/MocA family oxidoreductase [Planctomycetaceae bacterium]|nr:Gfo/Idh/MocA family oxidoreductase [Planctomycetaceae bacterium]